MPWTVALYWDEPTRIALWRYCPDVMRFVVKWDRVFYRSAVVWLHLFRIAAYHWELQPMRGLVMSEGEIVAVLG